MSKKYALSFFIIFLHLFSFGQSKGIILGNLKDKNTQETIFPGTIIVEGTDFKTQTDIDGNYKLDIPVGTYNIKAVYSGYVLKYFQHN